MVVLIILVSINCVLAQEPTAKETHAEKKYVTIETHDGSKISGELLEMDDNFFVIRTKDGELKINRSKIATAEISKGSPALTPTKYTDYSDSYFLLPSARPVGKGKTHYKNFNVFANQFNLGLSDNFSLGLGFESISLFAGNFPVTYVSPKVSIGGDKSYLGIGTTLFIIPYDGGATGGLAYLNYTYGSENQNFTVGTSFLYTSEADTSPLIFNINFMFPFSSKVSFVSEVIFGDFDGILFDIGVRIKTKSGINIDAGLIRPDSDIDGLIGYPLLGIAVPL